MSVFHEVADRIKEHARAQAPVVERYKVRRVSPLLLDQIDGENMLEDGDDDFVVGALVRKYIADVGLHVDDVVRVIFHDEEYAAMAVDD